MMRLLFHFLAALFLCFYKRLRGAPPGRPTWGFGFDSFVTALRLHARYLGTLPISELRRATDSLKAPLHVGITARSTEYGGVACTNFAPQNPSGVVGLFVHGGAFVFGSAAQDRGIISTLSSRLGMTMIAPDYRLAPEHPCPAGRDDVVFVLEALSQEYGDNVILFGLSSGGALALSALLEQTARDGAAAKGLVLLSPLLDLSMSKSSWTSNEGIDWGHPPALRAWGDAYAGGRALSDPEVSPAQAVFTQLPPTLAVNGTAELLHSDVSSFVARLQAQGLLIEQHAESDMVHAYMTFGRKDPATERSLLAIEHFVQTLGVAQAKTA